jgi:hypothetical protein
MPWKWCHRPRSRALRRPGQTMLPAAQAKYLEGLRQSAQIPQAQQDMQPDRKALPALKSRRRRLRHPREPLRNSETIRPVRHGMSDRCRRTQAVNDLAARPLPMPWGRRCSLSGRTMRAGSRRQTVRHCSRNPTSAVPQMAAPESEVQLLPWAPQAARMPRQALTWQAARQRKAVPARRAVPPLPERQSRARLSQPAAAVLQRALLLREVPAWAGRIWARTRGLHAPCLVKARPVQQAVLAVRQVQGGTPNPSGPSSFNLLVGPVSSSGTAARLKPA